MTKKKLFVISDLHLGGDEGFQMCSNQKNLADFINWLTTQKKSPENENIDFILVLAGDIIDFLAEKEWEAFTHSEEGALKKLEKVFDSFKEVWSALQKYVESGANLTILLGNHDIEMCLPKVRRRLMEELGNGKVEFIYDNEAFVMGDVLIEHGNRYDSWNAVDHDSLRQIRSLLSRNQDLGNARLETPGSVFVTTVMNDLKSTYTFIDLFKPENLAVALLLSTLEPRSVFSVQGVKSILFEGLLKSISLVKPVYYGQVANKSNSEGGMPTQPGLISGNVNERDSEKERFEDLLNEIGFDAVSIEALTENGNISGGGESWGDYAKGKLEWFNKKLFDSFGSEESAGVAEQRRLERIFKAFKFLIKTAKYDEKSVYTEAAKFLAKDFNVIVFGHTHQALKIDLDGVGKKSVYLNSGTWADVISLPERILEKTEPCEEFKQFVTDLGSKDPADINKWRTSKGTFVEIDLDENNTADSAEVYAFSGARAPRMKIS